MEHRWIDAAAVARRFGRSAETIRRWCRRGLFTRWRTLGPGRYVQIDAEADDDFERLYGQQAPPGSNGRDEEAQPLAHDQRGTEQKPS